MKLILLILILTLSSIFAKKEWKTKSHDVLINAGAIQGYDFNNAATSIKYDITSAERVDIFLIRASEFQKIKDGVAFEYLLGMENTRSASGEYSIASIISETVLTVVVNKRSGRDTQTSFKNQELLTVPDGRWNTRNFKETVVEGGLQGFDFNTASQSIKFDITTDQNVDMYLIRKSEWANLKDGHPFKYLWSAINTRSGSSTYSDTSVISGTVLSVVVNKRSGRSTQATFIHQELLLSSPGGGGTIDATTLIIIICVIAFICCCCCVGGGGGTIYSRRRRRHGSYVIHNDSGYGGNSYSGGSSGGNSYSSGGNRGGNSYSSGGNSGGNSYSSGGNSGGNSYN